MKIHFYVRFSTKYGQSLNLLLDQESGEEKIPMNYLNDEFWHLCIEAPAKKISYRYSFTDLDGTVIDEWESGRHLSLSSNGIHELVSIDTWNHAGDFENAFYTAPFQKVLLKDRETKSKGKSAKEVTHLFRVKAPLLLKNEVVCLSGSNEATGNWLSGDPVLLSKEGNWWTAKIHLSKKDFPLAYKYGIYNVKEKKFVRYEEGNNRLLHDDGIKKKHTVIHDGFVRLPNSGWKGAGVAVPVFSLRTKKSFGVGEFTDLKLLVDWSKLAGLKLIQLLPVNDTSATKTWTDSYPYAAISAFALHPIYLNLEKVAGNKYADVIKKLNKKQKELNALAEVDYEAVMEAKWGILKELYPLMKKSTFESDEFREFFKENQSWLRPYAAFCFFRDKYGTSHFDSWKTNAIYNEAEILKLSSAGSKSLDQIGLHYFIQFHLHLQLKEAADYAHKNGIVIKGDLPIGIYRYGCDAWVEPELYNMNMQAGAPPDDFAIKGQNWGFPTYNWRKMQEDGFAWWHRRFGQMSSYFDAFRIDHILGFFRIWSIPTNQVEGIMGYFIPAIPVDVLEFGEKGIWFDHDRYTMPFITTELLNGIFGEFAESVIKDFLVENKNGGYDLKPEYETQKQVECHFSSRDKNEDNAKLKQGLFDLISNVILFEEKGSKGERFHFRFGMEDTYSFQQLDWHLQQKLKDLYVDYFFRRQDEFWKEEALHKLPGLKESTNMLVCGEDLGMVPDCVPDVMKQLGILSLEIQRMPKDPRKEFFHPNDAPYLSVVTPSTHDMSTIRGWWEEDREKTQKFFNQLMGHGNEAPYFCEAWVVRAIILQHLYCPAMWSIFQLQDIMGMSETLRREIPDEERINIPANPRHYWRYRMHLTLESLIKEKEFNKELRGYVENSGR